MNTPVGKWATWVRDTFAQKTPKYTLKVEDHGWDQALRTSLLTAIAGGTVPEVTTGEAFVHEFASLGALQPVPDVNPKDFSYGTIAGSLYQDKLWGLPIYTSAFALETTRGSKALSSRMIAYASDSGMPLRVASAATTFV